MLAKGWSYIGVKLQRDLLDLLPKDFDERILEQCNCLIKVKYVFLGDNSGRQRKVITFLISGVLGIVIVEVRDPE